MPALSGCPQGIFETLSQGSLEAICAAASANAPIAIAVPHRMTDPGSTASQAGITAFFGPLGLYETPVMSAVPGAQVVEWIAAHARQEATNWQRLATLNTIDISVSIFAHLDYSRPSLKRRGFHKGLRRTPA